VLIAEGFDLPLGQTYGGVGPGFFVLAIGVALAILAAVLAVQIARGDDFAPEETEGADTTAPVSWRGLLLAGAGVFLPVGLIGWIGFPVAGGLAYACITRAYGSPRIAIDLAVGLGVAGATWFAFTRLGVQLGPFFPLAGR
jgi:putative tricarboxylic transport membrane protein